jgi:hypothetical protein
MIYQTSNLDKCNLITLNTGNTGPFWENTRTCKTQKQLLFIRAYTVKMGCRQKTVKITVTFYSIALFFVIGLIHRFHSRQPSWFLSAAHAHSAGAWWEKLPACNAFSMHFADQASAAECACVALRNQDGGQP